MKDITKVFTSEKFGSVRTVEIKGEPWFVGKDIADALGYKNTKDALAKHVDHEDKQGSRFATSGQSREMTVINESGLYSLVLSSKLPTAKEFKRWVTSDVLPSIRKSGSYTMELPHDYLSALEALVTTEKARQLAESQVKLMQPKADFYDTVASSESLLSMAHPAVFPEQLAHDHIKTWSNENDIIFDPFIGSRTTAVACMNTNRNFIGFEMNEEYYRIACNRIEEHKKTIDSQ